MQTGFILEGTKSRVLSDATSIILKEKTRHKNLCESNQVFDGYEADGITARHRSVKIPYSAYHQLLDKAFDAIKEQLAHCKDSDAVEVLFNLTVHRPNPE
jgi:hypothetical protein